MLSEILAAAFPCMFYFCFTQYKLPYIYTNICRIFRKVYDKEINTMKDSLTADNRAVRLCTSPFVGHMTFASLRSRV